MHYALSIQATPLAELPLMNERPGSDALERLEAWGVVTIGDFRRSRDAGMLAEMTGIGPTYHAATERAIEYFLRGQCGRLNAECGINEVAPQTPSSVPHSAFPIPHSKRIRG
jgi:hypothetical protein